MMKEFSFNRYLRTLGWFLQANRAQLLHWTAGSMLCIFVGQLFFLWLPLCLSNTTDFYATNVSAISGFFAAVIVIVMLIAPASIFASIQKKQRAISFFMLPATNGEKYAVLLTYVTLIWPLAVMLAFALGDTLRMLAMTLLCRVGFVSGIPYMLDILIPHALTGVSGFSLTAAAFILVFLVWAHSTYVAAGSAFRKHAFVIVTMALLAGISALAYVWRLLFGKFILMSSSNGVTTTHPLLWLLTLVLAAWAVYNYRLSFRMFKNLQVINNKRTNL